MKTITAEKGLKRFLSEVKDIPIDSLRVNPMNKKLFKQEGAEYYNDLLESMREKGQIVPIITRKDGTLIAGENRWNVAKALGWTTIKGQEVMKDISKEDELSLMLDEQLKRRHLARADRMKIYVEFFPNFEARLLETRGHYSKRKKNAKGKLGYAIDAKDISKKTGIKAHTVLSDLKKIREQNRFTKEISSPDYNVKIVRRTKLRCTMILKSLENQKPATVARCWELINDLKKGAMAIRNGRLKKSKKSK